MRPARLVIGVFIAFVACHFILFVYTTKRAYGMRPTFGDTGTFKPHVMITGGAGYIGSHAALALLLRGFRVSIVDNLSRGNYGAIDVLMKLAQPHQLAFSNTDLGDHVELERLIQRLQPHAIIHFAAIAYVGESIQHPVKYYQNVTANTINLLQVASKANAVKFIYSSSCATYGNPANMPITEATPQQPVSPYGRSKVAAEQAVLDAQASRNTSSASAILRYFNVIGSDPFGRLGEAPKPELDRKYGRISGACFATARGTRDHLAIMGTGHPTHDGTCVRDYIHVTDLVEAHIQVLESLQPGEMRIYNVGTGRGTSVRQFINSCSNATGRPLKVQEHPPRPGDAAAIYADCTKIKKEIGWEAGYKDITEALRTAWLWQQAHPTGYKDIKPPAGFVVSGVNDS
eukprot:TRINITY_DN6248_c0_g1_i4.p1 TRINITY_DN6248_c0_g1~~TRINITY_DN6248_c0_g1_i4.p1  ORF type:complete len:402 (+),score=50.67 TRINITY_DN6248_c0_g1_i4:206-1411(+)